MMLTRDRWAEVEEADVEGAEVTRGPQALGHGQGHGQGPAGLTPVNALLGNATPAVDLPHGDDSGRDERLAQVSGAEGSDLQAAPRNGAVRLRPTTGFLTQSIDEFAQQ